MLILNLFQMYYSTLYLRYNMWIHVAFMLYPVGFEMLKLVTSGQEIIRVAMLCPHIQGPGFPCGCPGANPGALFSVVVWTSTGSPNRSDSNRSASRSANKSSWSASGSANKSYRPALGHRVPNRKSKESDKDSQEEKQPHVCGFAEEWFCQQELQ